MQQAKRKLVKVIVDDESSDEEKFDDDSDDEFNVKRELDYLTPKRRYVMLLHISKISFLSPNLKKTCDGKYRPLKLLFGF